MEKQIDGIKDQLYHYLLKQKELEQEDIEANAQLSTEEKVEAGLLIGHAVVIRVCNHEYELKTTDDNTKLRVGDTVKVCSGKWTGRAKILDLGLDMLSIETSEQLVLGQVVNIEILQHMMLDPMIELLGSIEEGCPGYGFLNILDGREQPRAKGVGPINPLMVTTIPSTLNEQQTSAVKACLMRPSVYCLQGPPGTGKTAVLSTVAFTFAKNGKEVLVISNTHQAVNNALNKIAEKSDKLAVVKIGEEIKGEGLDKNIVNAKTYNRYLAYRKNAPKRQQCADIVGMTLHAAIVNLGLRNSGFKPKIVLVDEAGQMPLAYASLIGAFGCGSIIFIGDDKQMPPIFHPRLVSHPLSVSIFEYLCNTYPELRFTLNVTYRMNNVITNFVSKNFYESSEGKVKLTASDYSKDRRIDVTGISVDPIQLVEVKNEHQDMGSDVNRKEAEIALKFAKTAMGNGMKAEDLAVITPYRRQVKLMRSLWNESSPDCDVPLINTVECLQGQDVEMIVISFVASAKGGKFEEQVPFVLEKYRLNVMVSRAKTKVILLMSPELKAIFLSTMQDCDIM